MIALVLGLMPKGRYVVAAAQSKARQAVRGMVGLPSPREEIDNNWRRFRLDGIADSKKALVQVYETPGPRINA